MRSYITAQAASTPAAPVWLIFFFFFVITFAFHHNTFLKSTHSKSQHLLSLKQRLTSCKQSEFIAPGVRQIDRCQRSPVSTEDVDSV